jgi:hypothetical protein
MTLLLAWLLGKLTGLGLILLGLTSKQGLSGVS